MRSVKKGFTLIELLAVIAIISILSVIGMTQFASAREKARDAARRLDLSQFQHHLLSYYDDHDNVFPLVAGDTTGVTIEPDHSRNPAGAPTGIFLSGGVMIPSYLAQEVEDPYVGREGHEYFYTANCNESDCALSTGATDYIIYVRMEVGDYVYALGPGGKISDVSNQLSNIPTCPGTASADPTDPCTPPS